MAGAFGVEDYGRIAGGQLGDQELRRGQLEFAIGGGIQLAGPSIEELHGGGAGGDLRLQVDRCGARDFFEQTAEEERLVEQHGLRGGEAVARAALHEVAGQRPRSGGEAKDGDVRTERAAELANGIAQEARFAFGVEHGERFHLCGGADGRMR